MAQKISKKNQTRVLLKTRWSHSQSNEPIYIEPYTPMNEIIEQLEIAVNDTYTDRQIIDFKQYYQRIDPTDGYALPKKKRCMGWLVEYWINNEYVSSATTESMLNDENLKQIWTHKLSPVISTLTLSEKKPVQEITDNLNKLLHNPNDQLFDHYKQEFREQYKDNKDWGGEGPRGAKKNFIQSLKRLAKAVEDLNNYSEINLHEVQKLMENPGR